MSDAILFSRQFHQHFGCTMSEYMRRIRVARAQSPAKVS
jgi:transcriptional regulator GlxA family with amidase domain